ncbi:unnamed protein product, partial [Mesorhabditis belari]|uniref:Reverse transcriptase n=1 Tax=Mesorhabditis belari TaxID=2138241 RepID=A0AAF3EHU1_9BILA
MPTMKDEAPDSRIQWESLEESHNWIDSITLPEIRNIDETWRDLVQAIQRKARKNLGNREEKLNNDKFKNVPTLNEWKSHFEKLFSAKTPTLQLPELAPVENLELKIEEEDVEFSLKQMKTGKEAGVDDIPIDFWKLFPRAIKFLTDFFIAILESRKIPTQWKWAFIMPRYKGIGETNDCAMYRPIQHLSHTRKLFEKIFERKLRALGIGTTENQCGHKKNRGVKVAHRGLRSLLASSSPIHMAFFGHQKRERQCHTKMRLVGTEKTFSA